MNPERILKRLVPTVAGIVLFIVVVVALASGGDNNETQITPITSATTGSATLGKGAFIRQADQICAEANSSIANETASTSDQQLALEQQSSTIRSELDSLRALGKPESDRAALSGFLSALQGEVKALDQEQAALTSGDSTASSTAAAALAAAQTDARSAARKFGLGDCAKSGGATPGTATTPTPTTTTPTTVPTTATTTPTTATTPTTPAPSGGTGTGTGTGGGTGGGSGGVSP